ncbi:MAG: 5-formyltetrahydrofolate cyclo-ligase [Alphaproteobacteria bacterium]
MSIPDQKAALRKDLIKARPDHQPTASQYDFMASAIRERVPKTDFQMTAYLPIRRELDPLPLIERLAAFPVALPRTPKDPGPLDFRLWAVGEPLDEGLFKTLEPPATAPQLMAQTVVVLLPLVGFDRHLFRLGYGGGFYDRTLDLFRQQGRSVTALGLAYDSQRVDVSLPVEPTDEVLTAVITPTTVYEANSQD